MAHRHRSTFDSHFDPNSSGVNYGVLRGRVVRFGTEDATPTPHFQIIVQDAVPQIWRVAVNVRSDDGSNDQAALVDPLVGLPILTQLPGVAVGYTALPNHTPGLALDFVRDRLFDPAALQVLPAFGTNQGGLEDQLSKLSQAAINGAPDAEIYVWGSRFDVGNRPVAADKLYGDKVGMHDVHMNQGNPPPHQRDNGKYQDGGIIFKLADHYVGMFMKFQSQVGRNDAGAIVIP